MTTHELPSELAYQVETTFGTDPASWAANGLPLYHDPASVDLSAVAREMVEDPRNVDDIFAVHDKLHGLPTGALAASFPLHGTGAVTSAGDQVTQTELGKLLEHMMGGEDRTYSTLAGAGNLTTTTFDPVVSTGLDSGSFLAIEDTDDAGRLHVVRAKAWDGTTFTSDVALPFTPAEDDVIHGCEVAYIDSAVLVDSGGGNYTRAWLVQKGLASSKECYLFRGCKAEFASLTFDRGAPGMIGANIHYADVDGPDDQSEVTLATAVAGAAPIVIGGDATCWIEDLDTSTRTVVKAASLTITPGIPVHPQETVTTPDANTPGLSGWTVGPADTLITLDIIPHGTTWWDEFQADTRKVLRYQTVGSAGNVVAVHISNAQIVETPKRGTASQLSTTQLVLRAHMDAANADASNSALWRSKIIIVRA